MMFANKKWHYNASVLKGGHFVLIKMAAIRGHIWRGTDP